jgi:P4 family phage/plasmid primase-like protien
MTSTLSFNIKPQENILDGITLYETVDKSLLTKLINSTLLKTKETFKNKIALKFYETEKQQLEKYLASMNNGKIPVKYSRNANNPYGRSNPAFALGLFPFRKEIRHTLTSEKFVDIDVANCHPEMLNQLCIKENINHDKLDLYVNNRQAYFDEIVNTYHCTEEQAKILFIRLSYGGGFKNWVKDSEISVELCDESITKHGYITEIKVVTDFRESMILIHKCIEKSNPDLCDIVRKLKLEKGEKEGTYNLAGSVCSFVLQEYEIRVLEQMFLYVNRQGLIENGVCVLCADGIMIERRFYNQTLLNKLTNLIIKTIGFNLGFTQKEMKKGYNAIIDKHLCFDLLSPGYTTGFISDHFAVMYYQFISCNGVVYEYNGFIWKALDKKNTSLQKFVDDKYYKYLNSYCFKENEKYKALLAVATEDSIPSINKSLHNLKVYTNAILQLRINSTRNGLITDIITKITNNDIILNSNPYLFAFDNKIYDLKNNSFITAHKDQYITSTCGYNYSDFYPESRVITYRKLIDTIFPDKNVRDYYLTILATGLFGQQIEKLFVATGNGGNGKSLLNSQMLETVGNYGYKLGANVLLDVIKQGANPEVANMHRKRFVLCQEPDNKKLVCTATVKELTGDKEINARQLYSGDTKTLLNLTLIMECNQLPRLDEVTGGVQRRLEAIPFDARFVDKDTYDSLKNKSSLGIANPLYKTTEFQDEHRQALFIILLDYWKQFQINNYSMQSLPEVCKLITKDYMAMSDDIYGWFMEYYEPGDNSTDLVYIDEIFKTLKISEMFSLMSKKEQKNLTAKSFNEKIEKNIFLRENYLERKLYFNGDRLSKPALCGYIKKATPLLIED